MDGRDGRKGDMGEKGDCGEPGVVGPKGMPGVQGMDGEIGQPGETVRIIKITCNCRSLTILQVIYSSTLLTLVVTNARLSALDQADDFFLFCYVGR